MKKKHIIIIIGIVIIIIGSVIGYKIYDLNKASNKLDEMAKKMADHAMQKTGVNTESLKALQKKLDNLYND